MTNTNRTFADFAAEHRHGVFDLDITDAMREVLTAVARTGKSGAITVTSKVTARGDAFEITDTVKANVPAEPEPRIYWLDAEGFLSRSNPLQPSLPLGTPAGADPTTGEITR